jgi:alkylation response protein AidB-like acyl-CoA dehydrogenase
VLLWRTRDVAHAATRVESIDEAIPMWLLRVNDETRARAISSKAALGSLVQSDCDFLRNLSMVAAAAHATGLLDRALRSTIEYACDRTAFGRPIGSFQAVKHMLADTKVALEAARAIVAEGARRIDARDRSAGLASAIAARFVGRHVLDGLQSCVQVHGGIGVTMECELHHLVRRATALRFLYLEPFATGRRILALHAAAEAVHG